MKTNNLTNQEPMDWKREFDNRFYTMNMVHPPFGEIKAFISKWLQQEREAGRQSAARSILNHVSVNRMDCKQTCQFIKSNFKEHKQI